MTDKNIFALEMDLIHTIDSKKTSFWHKVLAALELSAISNRH